MRSKLLAAAVCALALALAGCGSESAGDPSRPAPSRAQFPAVEGRTLAELTADLDESRLVAIPTGQHFEPGPNRYSFGVFTLGRKEVADADVALYFAPGEEGKAIGPYPAAVESLETPAAYRALTSVEGPDATTVFYVVPRVELGKPGEWRAIALLRTPRGIEWTRMPSVLVGGSDAVPAVGERPPRVNTPTADDVGGKMEQIDTRVPPDQMHREDFAEVLGRKPVVLLFSTPQFCESRVCGPVVDIAEQVRDELGDRAAFIHMEVFQDNDPNAGPRPQLTAFGLETEPWLFVIDADGTIDTRIEGAFSANELRQAVRRVTQ